MPLAYRCRVVGVTPEGTGLVHKLAVMLRPKHTVNLIATSQLKTALSCKRSDGRDGTFPSFSEEHCEKRLFGLTNCPNRTFRENRSENLSKLLSIQTSCDAFRVHRHFLASAPIVGMYYIYDRRSLNGSYAEIARAKAMSKTSWNERFAGILST